MTTNVPITIEPEALEFAEKIGLRPVMEQIIDKMIEMTPKLCSIQVSYETSPYDPTADPQVFIEGIEPRSAHPPEDRSLMDRFRRWVIGTYPPEVFTNFVTNISARGEG